MIFYPKMMCVFFVLFFSEYLKFTFFCQNNLSLTKSCQFHFLRDKRRTDMARKRSQPFKRLKMPHYFPIDHE